MKIIFYPLSKACNNMEERYSPCCRLYAPVTPLSIRSRVLHHKTVKALVAAVNTKILAVVRTAKTGVNHGVKMMLVKGRWSFRAHLPQNIAPQRGS